MKSRIQLALAALVVAWIALASSAAHAAIPGAAHTRAQIYHSRAPRAHSHGVHVHHS